jgi:lon-related putative ATP-dependent protease
MAIIAPLPARKLRTVCDPARLEFKTTADLAPLVDSLGQERAVEAVRFGVAMRHEGYNLFALGPPGTGKHTLVSRHLEERAKTEPVPPDWCYVNNFAEPHKPRRLQLPAGRAVAFAHDMDRLVDDLQAAIRSTFESEDYNARKHAIEEELSARQEKVLNELQEKAKERNASLIRTQMGFTVAPTQRGEVVTPEVFRQWPEEHQEKVKQALSELEDELQRTLKQFPVWQREARDKLRQLNHETTSYAVEHLIGGLKERYAELPDVISFLDDAQKDVVEHADEFIATQADNPEAAQLAAARRAFGPSPTFRRYRVNVIVNNSKLSAAPVIYEDHPTLANLVGRIEHMAQFGALMTDFNLIKPGALHAANGGYLVLDVRKVLQQPVAWEELKRVLFSHEIRIQGIPEAMGWATTVSLDPQPIPISVKVVLLGDRTLYYLLSQLDPDFPGLFKVAADFDDRMDRTSETDRLYARLIASMVVREGLRHFDAGAVAQVIEEAARNAADAEKLSLLMRPVLDLVREADYWAGVEGRKVVTAPDVRRAVEAWTHRLDRMRERSQEEIRRGTILIDTKGAKVGQVNGLSVLQLGEFAFGRPSRITARVRLGRGEVVDIEREVALGGPLHSKGVLILAGFVGERFGRQGPLALSASIVFEQSYGGVDGDSASSAEVYALLSALSGVPIKQNFAVTGSVSQHGDVQPIGGANEKIEGFFDVCRARGLTGDQGVLIPATNVKHLMLRPDVVEAAAAGKFQIYPVETIDQGIEILTGVPAGTPGADGKYPPGSVNGLAQAELARLAEKARAMSPAARESER